jgi:hypothetical protein
MSYKYKTVQNPGDIPVGKHWAIMTFGSITIPGDERSRTNPGHGYPESTQTTTTYKLFESEADWLAEIEKMEAPRTWGRKEDYIALVVERPSITAKVQIRVGS